MKKYFKNNENFWNYYSLKSEYNTNIGKSQLTVLKDPIVSSFLINNGYNPQYPDGKSFAICLTHDIDEINTPMIHRAHSFASTITSANINNLSDVFQGLLDKKKNKYRDFGKIMTLEEKYEAKSTFFFLTAKKDPLRFRYKIEDVANELSAMKDRGFEIGLHGGYYSYNDFEALSKEKKILERNSGINIEGYRSHYLNLNIPRTWIHLSKLGFKYDTSLGYRKGIGFRNGMCHPFHPYLEDDEKGLFLLEIPLIIMDAVYPTFNFKMSTYWEEILHIIETVERNHGVLTINWHNDSLLSTRKLEHSRMYEKILIEGKKRGAWLTNCHTMCDWWNRNSKQFES